MLILSVFFFFLWDDIPVALFNCRFLFTQNSRKWRTSRTKLATCFGLLSPHQTLIQNIKRNARCSFYSKTNYMHQCYQIYFILEWNSTCFGRYFRPSSGVRYCCLLVSGYPLASRQQYLPDICLLLYVQSWTADDGRKDRPKQVECHSKIKYIWYIGACSWFYYRNNITTHSPVNVKNPLQY